MTTAIGGGAGATTEGPTCYLCLNPMDPSAINRIRSASDKQRALAEVVQRSLQDARTLAQNPTATFLSGNPNTAAFPLHMGSDSTGSGHEPHAIHLQCYAGQTKTRRKSVNKCGLCRKPLDNDLPDRVFAATHPSSLAKRIVLAVAGMFELLLAVPLFIAFGLAGMSTPAAACVDLIDQGFGMITRGDSRVRWNTVNKIFDRFEAETMSRKISIAALGCLPVPILSPFLFFCPLTLAQAGTATEDSASAPDMDDDDVAALLST